MGECGAALCELPGTNLCELTAQSSAGSKTISGWLPVTAAAVFPETQAPLKHQLPLQLSGVVIQTTFGFCMFRCQF